MQIKMRNIKNNMAFFEPFTLFNRFIYQTPLSSWRLL